MEELRAILIKYNALDIFCDAIIEKNTRSSSDATNASISKCIDQLINWSNTERIFGCISDRTWQKIHIEFRDTKNLGKFNCTREEIASRLRSKKIRLHKLIVGRTWMN